MKSMQIQFGLRTFFILISVCAVIICYVSNCMTTARNRQSLRAKLENQGWNFQNCVLVPQGNGIFSVAHAKQSLPRMRVLFGDSPCGTMEYPYNAPTDVLENAKIVFPEANLRLMTKQEIEGWRDNSLDSETTFPMRTMDAAKESECAPKLMR
jgi:hypothetical protein